MASEAQFRANRENAKKSTGPVSEAGLAVSSQNAAKHRMFAVFPVAGPEDAQEFQTLLECLRDQYLPGADIEMDLIHQMADARWRYLRACEEERALYNLDYKKHGAADPANYDRGEAFIRLSDSGHLKYSRRCQSTFDRKYQKSLAELRRLQGERLRPQPEPRVHEDEQREEDDAAVTAGGRAYLAAKEAEWRAAGLIPNVPSIEELKARIGFVSANSQTRPTHPADAAKK